MDHDPAAADEVVARANSTLAALHARIEIRTDRDIATRVPGRQERRGPGPVGRLARLAASAAWKRLSPEMDLESAREYLGQTFRHQVGEGFVEPAADRYQIIFGGYAVMYVNGQHYGGEPGKPLQANHRSRNDRGDPLDLLRKLRGVTDARHVGHEAVRGTPCHVVAVSVGPAEFTVWADDEHIRRIQAGDSASAGDAGVSSTVSSRETLELWDFGTEDGSADWTRLPRLRTAEHMPETDP